MQLCRTNVSETDLKLAYLFYILETTTRMKVIHGIKPMQAINLINSMTLPHALSTGASPVSGNKKTRRDCYTQRLIFVA